jgi:hypothetical protein
MRRVYTGLAPEDFDPFGLLGGAQVIKEFIEDYHERAEEKKLFPRFRRANKLTDLIDVLLSQQQKAEEARACAIVQGQEAAHDGTGVKAAPVRPEARPDPRRILNLDFAGAANDSQNGVDLIRRAQHQANS